MTLVGAVLRGATLAPAPNTSAALEPFSANNGRVRPAQHNVQHPHYTLDLHDPSPYLRRAYR